MSITATVSSSTPITASVTESGASVSVSAATIAANVTGGIGPQGPSGDTGGETGGATTLAELSDVEITAAAEGDVLRYNGSKWADYSELLLTDGGNF